MITKVPGDYWYHSGCVPEAKLLPAAPVLISCLRCKQDIENLEDSLEFTSGHIFGKIHSWCKASKRKIQDI